MRALTLVHRWLGIPLCLLFAMWFASGIVMHFVPFPTLTEAERLDGLAPIELPRVLHSPSEAVQASGIKDVTRVRLLQRSDGPGFLVSAASGVAAFRAGNLSPAALPTQGLALAVALDHARRRGMDVARAEVSALTAIDQWTVSGGFDPHRPLFRISLNDQPDTELYVSSTTGEVVCDTTRHERWWNYVGSVAHWIYPAALRSRPAVWSATVWLLSLAALITALAGSMLGILRVKMTDGRIASPYQGWQKWHHVLGLVCMIFVLTWIFSGWLSMDHGRLFSTGKLSSAETAAIAGTPAWESMPAREAQSISAHAREVEWFVFNRKFYRRDRTSLDAQRLVSLDSGVYGSLPQREFLDPGEISAFVERLASGCNVPVIVHANDNYAIVGPIPNAPVYRSVCGGVWFHIDGASGAILERLDPSRRAYRWFYSALHTMDFPILSARRTLRSALVVILCGFGFVFSLTGVVIGWRRLRLQFSL
jgi:uncharacterized iron-regulated membrane protein